MSSRNDDGHHPSTCNWTRCEAVDPRGPCPFLKPDKLADNPVVQMMEEAAKRLHEHRYTVPVEWSEKMGVNRNGPDLLRLGLYFVTKLRCESCESEVER